MSLEQVANDLSNCLPYHNWPCLSHVASVNSCIMYCISKHRIVSSRKSLIHSAGGGGGLRDAVCSGDLGYWLFKINSDADREKVVARCRSWSLVTRLGQLSELFNYLSFSKLFMFICISIISYRSILKYLFQWNIHNAQSIVQRTTTHSDTRH